MSSTRKILWAWPTLLLLVLAAMLPIYGPMMVYAEGSLFPVASKIKIIEQTPSRGGLDIRFTYYKYRFCELEGFSAKAGQFDVDMSLAPIDATPLPVRAPGLQTSRLWHIAAASLDGIDIWFIHRCSPLWLTATQVYP